MDRIRILLSRCAALFERRKLDNDLDEELRTHIDLAVEDNLKHGISEQEARTQALRKFGGVAQTREQYRTQRGLPFLEVVGRDLKFGFRQLLKSPGFTIAAVLTLALGIGLSVGLLITFLLRRVAGSVLVVQFERDGIVIAALVVLLATIGLVAALIPMRRAASIDPMRALRSE